MSYRGQAKSTDELCFPKSAVYRLQPRAAGPMIRELASTSGKAKSVPIPADRGLLVIDPRYDHLPRGRGWEWRLT